MIIANGYVAPTDAQIGNAQDVMIQLHVTPPVVESGPNTYSIGYVNIISGDSPITTTDDLEIQLTSSDPDIASVPSTVIIPNGKDYAKFDVTVGTANGQAEISAKFQDQIASEIFRVGETVGTMPSDVQLQIAFPSDKMNVNTQMPFSVFLQSNGTAIQAPEDIAVSFEYEKSLIKPVDNKIIIKKGGYYALTEVKSLEQVGNAFIKATADEFQLNTVSSIQISSTVPTSLAVDVFPPIIANTERKIDVFVSLLDSAGSPTIATEDIPLQFFSDDVLLEASIHDSLEPNGATIKKGEFGYHLSHPYIFQTGRALRESISIGASAPNIGVDASNLAIVEPLDANHPKAENKTLLIFTLDRIPNNATSILVYQLNAIESDSDDSSAIEGLFASSHPIDDFADKELYPVQSVITYSSASLVENLKIISTDNSILTISDLGGITVSSSYGTALLSSGQKSGSVTLSTILGGIGSDSITTNVVSILAPTQTKIFSPIGENKIIFNNEGYCDLFIMFLDSSGRPTSSKDPIRYLITPINDFIEIKSKQNFARILVYSSSFGGALQDSMSDIKVTPIGIEAKSNLEATSSFELAKSSSIIKVTTPFESITGADRDNPIGVVQLIDLYGNPIKVTNNLNVNLSSDNTQAIQVPSSVMIPKDHSFAEFPVKTFGIEGSSFISASASNVGGSAQELAVKPFSAALKISFDPISTPISFGQDISIKIFVDSENNIPQNGAFIKLTPGEQSTVVPETITTDEVGSATVVLKALAGPATSLTVHASKDGFTDAERTIDLEVSGAQVVETGVFLGIPTWVMYVAVAGAVGAIGVVAFVFLRKPKAKTVEEEEEEI